MGANLWQNLPVDSSRFVLCLDRRIRPLQNVRIASYL